MSLNYLIQNSISANSFVIFEIFCFETAKAETAQNLESLITSKEKSHFNLRCFVLLIQDTDVAGIFHCSNFKISIGIHSQDKKGLDLFGSIVQGLIGRFLESAHLHL